MRLVILGGPGAGKGTQTEYLCSYLSIPCISTGEILREAIAAQTSLGVLAEPYVKIGELVRDETMIEFIRLRLMVPDVTNGWLLDGYPRTAFQAEELDFLVEEFGQKVDWAIYLDVADSVLMSRSLGRSRADDRPEIVKRRIQLFRDRTIPILEYYEHRQKLLTVNGDQPPEQIHQEIVKKLMGNS
ncbi:adenylate kinase [Oscillatoriales cyanobacterium USR001]|nr:adenylate kinase [Oscillatoriales cyanobacterium USR001]